LAKLVAVFFFHTLDTATFLPSFFFTLFFKSLKCYTRFLNDKTAKQRYLQILKHENDILQRVPLVYLASYLQVAPETLSRIRKEISTS
jgi:hypothetical protein